MLTGYLLQLDTLFSPSAQNRGNNSGTTHVQMSLHLPPVMETLSCSSSQPPVICIDYVSVIDRVTWKTSVLTAGLELPEELKRSVTAELQGGSPALQNVAEAAPCSHQQGHDEVSWETKLYILTHCERNIISLRLYKTSFSWAVTRPKNPGSSGQQRMFRTDKVHKSFPLCML